MFATRIGYNRDAIVIWKHILCPFYMYVYINVFENFY